MKRGPAAEPEKTGAPAAQEAAGGPVPAKARAKARANAKPRRAAAAPKTAVGAGALDIPTLPALADVPVAVVKRSEVSLRGKREISLQVPTSSAQVMQVAYRSARPAYRKAKVEVDPAGDYRLTLSAFLGQALNFALDNPHQWVESIPNDARNDVSAQRVPRKQMGLIWPVATVSRFHESWEVLEAGVAWPEGFSLTKANLAATGILWALEYVDQWVGDVPNDDRLSEPVVGDGRLRQD